MMERDWRPAAELRASDPRRARFNLATPRSRCPTRPPDHAREHPGGQLPVAARTLPPHAAPASASATRSSSCSPPLLSAFAAWHFGFGLQRPAPCCSFVGRWSRSPSSTSTPSCCPTTSPCRCCGWAWLQPRRHLHRAAERGRRRDGGLSRAVVGVLAVQARHRQGRHGLWRLQAARPRSAPGWAGRCLPLTILLSSLVGAVVGIALIVPATMAQRADPPSAPSGRRRRDRVVLRGNAARAHPPTSACSDGECDPSTAASATPIADAVACPRVKPHRTGFGTRAFSLCCVALRPLVFGLVMPIYEYVARAPAVSKKTPAEMSATPRSACPSCGAGLRQQQLSAAGFPAQGQGWYATDFSGRHLLGWAACRGQRRHHRASSARRQTGGASRRPAGARPETTE